MTIKIISYSEPSEANLQAVEREEQILAIAKVITASSTGFEASDMDQCAAKIRSASSKHSSSSIERLASDISNRLSKINPSKLAMNAVDVDIQRIVKLLEG
jgi:hypothetical protein